jgi:hypothetical protein
MRRIIHRKTTILILVLLIFSCKKDTPSITPKNIVGEWKWFQTYADLPLSPTNPSTPQNSAIEELLVFNTDKTWKQIQNSLTTDSGTYTLGHSSYTPYIGAYTYDYDSIGFYKKGVFVGWDGYLISSGDTLIFGSGITGRFSSYMVPNNGSKWYVKQ